MRRWTFALGQFHAEAVNLHLEIPPARKIYDAVRQIAHHITALIYAGILGIIIKGIENEFFF